MTFFLVDRLTNRYSWCDCEFLSRPQLLGYRRVGIGLVELADVSLQVAYTSDRVQNRCPTAYSPEGAQYRGKLP